VTTGRVVLSVDKGEVEDFGWDQRPPWIDD
jgi:hypothetical protein